VTKPATKLRRPLCSDDVGEDAEIRTELMAVFAAVVVAVVVVVLVKVLHRLGGRNSKNTTVRNNIQYKMIRLLQWKVLSENNTEL
jgi:hypothetical protein